MSTGAYALKLLDKLIDVFRDPVRDWFRRRDRANFWKTEVSLMRKRVGSQHRYVFIRANDKGLRKSMLNDGYHMIQERTRREFFQERYTIEEAARFRVIHEVPMVYVRI